MTSFAYQLPRQRAGSITSFTYFQDEDETPEWSDEEAVVDVSDGEEAQANGYDRDLEIGEVSSLRRKSSSRTRPLSDQPLLQRHSSNRSETQGPDGGGSVSQKLYIESEDLTMVAAGFSTSPLGFSIYVALCCLTGGIGYLVLRWLPRWRIRLVGCPAPLKTCSWVVVEVSHRENRRWSTSTAKNFQNQWGEFTVHNITSEEYGHPLSTVFGSTGKEKRQGYRHDDDPELETLKFLDYRYMRLLYHPLEDKFVLNNSWWDPQWTDVKALRAGLDSEERDPRDQVFGKNVIEIQQKSIPQLLLDEVSSIAGRFIWLC
jgi:cation-transporting P-type ATPase 13A2